MNEKKKIFLANIVILIYIRFTLIARARSGIRRMGNSFSEMRTSLNIDYLWVAAAAVAASASAANKNENAIKSENGIYRTIFNLQQFSFLEIKNIRACDRQ